jgi:signal transduction histidine kinase
MMEDAQLFEAVFGSLSLGVVVFDQQLRVLRRNPAAARLLGDHDCLADVLDRLTPDGEPRDWRAELVRSLDDHHERRFDQVFLQCQPRQERIVNLLLAPIEASSPESQAAGVLILEDVTTLLSLEKRVAVSERMAAVGRLAAKVAHELSNPLDGVLRYINLARRVAEPAGNERLTGYLDQARKGMMRVIHIVGELLEFSRGRHTGFDQMTLDRLLDDAIHVMEDKARQQKVLIICDYQKTGVPAIRAGNLFHVFCNLIKNAIDAMPTGGKLTIKVTADDRQVMITFRDTGVGLPADADHIFDPFFTTKPPGKGTGLGLAICKEIVEKHKGRITAERPSDGKGGALFRVCLPIDPAQRDATRATAVASSATQGGLS